MLTKLRVMFLTSAIATAVALGASAAAEQQQEQKLYSPPGLPNVFFNTPAEAAAFDLGFKAATWTILQSCEKKGYFGGGDLWYKCHPDSIRKT